MGYEKLDFFFPFFVLAYGFLVVLVLEIPVLAKHPLGQHLEPKRNLAWICAVVGALWSLQNLVFA